MSHSGFRIPEYLTDMLPPSHAKLCGRFVGGQGGYVNIVRIHCLPEDECYDLTQQSCLLSGVKVLPAPLWGEKWHGTCLPKISMSSDWWLRHQLCGGSSKAFGKGKGTWCCGNPWSTCCTVHGSSSWQIGNVSEAVQNSNSYRFYVVCWFLGWGTLVRFLCIKQSHGWFAVTQQ